MNLNSVAAGVVSAVNPWSTAQYRASSGGYTTAPSGRRTPAYADPQTVRCQVQALTFKDLAQLQGLNLGGKAKAIYVDGDWKGVSRASQEGGDLIAFEDGTVWLVIHVLENWHDTVGWTKVAAVLQGAA